MSELKFLASIEDWSWAKVDETDDTFNRVYVLSSPCLSMDPIIGVTWFFPCFPVIVYTLESKRLVPNVIPPLKDWK